ncbi:MAG: flavoprotein [Candidatus Omnitrophota bacterium]|jgi:phosphopantothenoylcysteine decarboxylase/phosphopantothenate--cysteine ligase
MKKSSPSRKRLQGKTVLHILTGSIAAYKAGDLVQAIRREGGRAICVLTESAKHFVTPLALRALSGEYVYHDFFSTETPYGVVHTSLVETSDVILVAPASADFIARLAAGLADDLASCLILATHRPVLIAPAMNDQMYLHPVTQRNIRSLKEIGYHFIDPVEGPLVCGKEAIGHISDPETIVQSLARFAGLKTRERKPTGATNLRK